MTEPQPVVGYIYVRCHESYDTYNACKLGMATNILDRDSTYATGEIKRGQFVFVCEISGEEETTAREVEGLLQREFLGYHIYEGAGTEFYRKEIISLIEPLLQQLPLTYRLLSPQEITELVRSTPTTPTTPTTTKGSCLSAAVDPAIPPDTPCDTFLLLPTPTLTPSPFSVASLDKEKESPITYIPRSYQTQIVEKGIHHFLQHDRGVLVLMCGVGKTLISLWIAQGLGVSTILVGVPGTPLLSQWGAVIRQLFPSVPFLPVSEGVSTNDISGFLQKNRERCVLVTTYASAHKVHTATTTDTPFEFGMKINDECHHLTTSDLQEACEKKSYVRMFQIPTRKQLSLTATIKQLEGGDTLDVEVVSNDTVQHFGEIIDRKGLLWAITENVICDYVIQTIVKEESQIETLLERCCVVEDHDKRLFLSAFAALKSIAIGHSHHLLIYANTMDNARKLHRFVTQLLANHYFDETGLFVSRYDSKTKEDTILDNFAASRYGIILCVYCLGEGWDFPLLDGVVFAENMTSPIRILQSALRPGRKNKDEPNKKFKIILPVLTLDDYNENEDLKIVREVIYQMGMEDETICQKIRVLKLNMDKQTPTTDRTPCRASATSLDSDEWGEYDEAFSRRFRLKTTDRITKATSFQKAKRILLEKHITSKETYFTLCDKDIRLPRDPEAAFRGLFTTWTDYLGIEGIYYDLETCKRKSREYIAEDSELKKDHPLDLATVCRRLCQKDLAFPPEGLWTDYYRTADLSSIIPVGNKKKARLLLG